MRVCLVTVGEPLPLPGSGTRPWRAALLARSLAARGHTVTWWTSDFDHVTKRHVLVGQGRVALEPGVDLRVLHAGSYRRNVSVSRIRNHRQLGRALAKAIRADERPDVIVASFPPVELAYEASRFGREVGVPVVIDVRDLWPDILVDVVPGALKPIGRLALSSMFRQASAALNQATGIAAVSAGYLDWGLAKAGRPARATDVVFPLGYEPTVPSAEDRARIDTLLGNDRTRGDCPIAVFAGSFGRTYDLTTVIEAARKLAQDPAAAIVEFVLCGGGDRDLEWRSLAEGVPGITFTGWLSAGELAAVFERSTWGLAAYARGAPQGISNKLIEYMAAGLPIVSSLDGEAARLIAELGVGVTYRSDDPADLATVMRRLAADLVESQKMGAAGSRAFADDYASADVFLRMAVYVETVATTAVR
jgi:glycosyltransferase involved in cell wall biosynthesis